MQAGRPELNPMLIKKSAALPWITQYCHREDTEGDEAISRQTRDAACHEIALLRSQ